MNYRLPPRFVLDHISRDLLSPDAIVRTTKRYVEVELTDAQAEELLHDAEHYADECGGWLTSDHQGLVASARATVKRLKEVRATHYSIFVTNEEGDTLPKMTAEAESFAGAAEAARELGRYYLAKVRIRSDASGNDEPLGYEWEFTPETLDEIGVVHRAVKR